MEIHFCLMKVIKTLIEDAQTAILQPMTFYLNHKNMAISCIQCNMLDSNEDFYETHQWLPERLWCINKK